MRRTLVFLAVLLSSALPLSAFAQSAQDSSQIAALLAEVQQLEQQIASLSGSSTPAAVSGSTPVTSVSVSGPGASSSSGACPALSRSLSEGASGSDVFSLQAFLTEQGFFAESATGYFGPITAQAVGQWQESQGIVSGSSDPGFGVVGPKTRAAIAASCGGSSSAPVVHSCLPAAAPSEECSTGWKPVADSAGCTIYFQCAISLPGAASSTAPASSSSNSTSSSVCQNVPKPSCTGSVVPFQTDSNGCVSAYECVL